jgi:hypothetical protein
VTQLKTRFKHSLLIQLLEPTLGGSLLALAFAMVALIGGRLPRVSHQLNELYIPQAIDNIKHQAGHAIISLLTHSLHGYANNFFLVLFWVIMGVIIYSLIHGLGKIFVDLEENLAERNYLWPTYADRNQHLAIFITKTGFRIAIFILLAVYTLALVPKELHGLNNFLDHSGTGTPLALHSLLFLAAAWLLSHVFIVLLRLITLRTRLFYMS